VRRYFRREGTLVGELYNIGTPVEFFPDHLRYVDLELDVVRLPDGTSRLEDEGVLEDKLARGLLPPALGQAAMRIAVGLLQGFATASPNMDLQQSFPPSP
jgi:predicted RNA-binding protein associated with RNAse of E/G family